MKRTVTVRKNNASFELRLIGIRDGIMKVASTEKTRAFGVPEYFTCIYSSDLHSTYRGNNGWSVSIWY